MKLFNNSGTPNEPKPDTRKMQDGSELTEEQLIAEVQAGERTLDYASLMNTLLTDDDVFNQAIAESNIDATCGCGKDDCQKPLDRATAAVPLLVEAMMQLNGFLPTAEARKANVERLRMLLATVFGISGQAAQIFMELSAALVHASSANNRD